MESKTTSKIKGFFNRPFRKKAGIHTVFSPISLSNQQGYSLFEVILVLALLTILSTIALFQFDPVIKKYRLTGAARLVLGDFLNAKTIALKENRSIRVDFSSPSYSFVRVDTNNTFFSRNLSNEYKNVSIAKQGGGSVLFSSTGQTSAATVLIQGPSGSKTLTLSWTGRIVLN